MSGYTTASPFAGAPESLWRNADLDPRLQALRAMVAETDAKEQKLQEAVLSGRLYGLGHAHYAAIRQAQLRAVLKKQSLTSELW